MHHRRFFTTTNHIAVDLLEKMLVFDPRKRVKAGDALAHEYLEPYHDPTDEPVADEKFDWSFNDADLPVDTWKIMMYVLVALPRLGLHISGTLKSSTITTWMARTSQMWKTASKIQRR